MKPKYKGVYMLEQGTFVRADEVVEFVPSGLEETYTSKLLLDTEICDEQLKVQVNQGTLKAGKSLPGSVHDAPEIYYILQGECKLTVGEEEFMVSSNDVVYIPKDTFHKLDNSEGNADVILITLWSLPMEGKGNEMNQVRKREWGGKCFKELR